jgi:type III secretory pathway lipoprotein EscJ
MSAMVQVALASDLAEGEEIQALLSEAGIDAQLEPAVDHHPRETDDVPTKVLVPEATLEDALAAIEAFSEPDELGSEA